MYNNRSEGSPERDIWAPGCEWWTGPGPRRRLRLDLAAAAAAVAAATGGGESQNPNPSFFDACGRSRDAAAGILIAKTVEFFSVSKKLGPRSQNLGQEGQKSENPEIQKSENPRFWTKINDVESQ